MIRRGAGKADSDHVLLSRARQVMALQTAAAITVSLIVVGVLALLVVTRGQNTAATASLRQVAASADDVVDAPTGMWIFERNAQGRTKATADAPRGLPDRTALDRVQAGGPTEITKIDAPEGGYLALTRRRGTQTVQVVMSLREQHEERERLLAALGAGELVGLLVALLCAALLSRRATAPLAEALARQRQFVADASHELRTPLTQLHTRAQLLQLDVRGGATITDVAPDIDQLVTGTRQLGEVVEDLLLSSQLDRHDGAVAAVDLRAVAADVVAGERVRAENHDVQLALVTDAAEPSVVRGRVAALRRVLTALVDNALSHTPPGGHVTIELGTDGPTVTVVVRDDGAGFDPVDSERLFARFARGGHGDQRRFGLGLALAREVITGHGGSIEAWGRPGEGAAFSIRLPASRALDD